MQLINITTAAFYTASTARLNVNWHAPAAEERIMKSRECLQRSAVCFRRSEGAGFNQLELRGLMILGYALWERATELEARELKPADRPRRRRAARNDLRATHASPAI
jgi:hypothetical protein